VRVGGKQVAPLDRRHPQVSKSIRA
jgi:hypothetical protein